MKYIKSFERVINYNNLDTITPEERSTMLFNIDDIVRVTEPYNSKERSGFYRIQAFETTKGYHFYWLSPTKNGRDIGWVEPMHMVLVPDYEVDANKYNL